MCLVRIVELPDAPVTCIVCLCLGPAGTGKTESVKALGNQMGRFVLVFNCDETFDFQVKITDKAGYIENICFRRDYTADAI